MRFAVLYTAEALGQSGQIADGLAALEDAITRAERTAELWQFPELLGSRASLFYCRGRKARWPQPRITFGRRSIGGGSRARFLGNCGLVQPCTTSAPGRKSRRCKGIALVRLCALY